MRNPRHTRSCLVVVVALVALVVATFADAAPAQRAAETGRSPGPVLRFDVAEDPTRYVFSPSPVHGHGSPAYGAGERTVVTDGYGLPEVGVAVRRAVTGGTGPFAAARGEQVQRLLGLGAANGVKLRVAGGRR